MAMARAANFRFPALGVLLQAAAPYTTKALTVHMHARGMQPIRARIAGMSSLYLPIMLAYGLLSPRSAGQDLQGYAKQHLTHMTPAWVACTAAQTQRSLGPVPKVDTQADNVSRTS